MSKTDSYIDKSRMQKIFFFYLLKVRRGKKADRQSETRSLVLTEAINSRVVHWKAKRKNGRIRLYSQ